MTELMIICAIVAIWMSAVVGMGWIYSVYGDLDMSWAECCSSNF